MVFGYYPSVFLLSSLSEIFQNVAFKQILGYLISNNLLFNSQYENYSTELAAFEFVDRKKLEMDWKKNLCPISLDLSKAFDMLTHDILLPTLRYIPMIWSRNAVYICARST